MQKQNNSKNINIKHVINCADNNIELLVKESENRFKKQLITTANDISKKGGVEIIMVAGPSCAGKTTFTRMLCDKLRTKGYEPVMVSLDDFFYNREDTPFLEDGVTRDYESLQGINIAQIHTCFLELKSKKVASFPIFDFVNGINIPNKQPMKLTQNTILVVEGIHALNPAIISAIGFKSIYKIYISAESSFAKDRSILISGDQLRYMRRIMRDRVARGNDPITTFKSWPKVMAGEQLYIAPYKYTADALIDTTHAYELVLFRYYLNSILGSMKYSAEALYLQYVLTNIKGYSKKIIPEFSLMWEFVKK